MLVKLNPVGLRLPFALASIGASFLLAGGFQALLYCKDVDDLAGARRRRDGLDFLTFDFLRSEQQH